jgi:hypothetical protein
VSRAKKQAEKQEPNHGHLHWTNVVFILSVLGSHSKALICILKILLTGGREMGGGGAANIGYCMVAWSMVIAMEMERSG